jgi:hypothetical protein
MVLIRSEKGKWVYRGALTAGYIKERKYPSVQKARSDWIKLQTMVVGFSQRKRDRALRKWAALTGFVAPSLNSR